jgi:hypothetical protein
MSDPQPKGKAWIKNMIELIQEDIRNISDEEKDTINLRQRIAVKYQTFFEKFPSLLMKVVDDGDDFDMDRLDGMLDLMEQVHNNELDLEETNTRMGQEYFNQYVRPHIDEAREQNAANQSNTGKGSSKGGPKKSC